MDYSPPGSSFHGNTGVGCHFLFLTQGSSLHLLHWQVDSLPLSKNELHCESWTVKKAECQRLDAFELWCWRRLFRVPWTARRFNQSILKDAQPRGGGHGGVCGVPGRRPAVATRLPGSPPLSLGDPALALSRPVPTEGHGAVPEQAFSLWD